MDEDESRGRIKRSEEVKKVVQEEDEKEEGVEFHKPDQQAACCE